MKTIKSVVVACALTLSISTPLHAQVFEFSCGNVEFILDLKAGKMSDRINGVREVDWNYSDNELKWRGTASEQWNGLNVGNGAYFSNGIWDDEAGCLIDNITDANLILSRSNTNGLGSAVTQKPFSPNEIKQEFSKISREDLASVQNYLSYLGFYNSSVDGIWGNNTATALFEAQEDFAASGWSLGDEDKGSVPTSYLEFVLMKAKFFEFD